MYVIRAAGETCRIIDAEDRVRFVGDLWECENWLDRQENLAPTPPAKNHASTRGRLAWSSLQRWVSQGTHLLPRAQ